MFKQISLILLSLAVILQGCSKKSEPSSGSLVGHWRHLKDIDAVYENNVYGLTDTTSFNDPNEYMQFNRGNTGVLKEFDIGSNNYVTTNFQYVLSGSQITVTGNGETEVLTIKKLTENSLVTYSEFTNQSGDVTITDKVVSYYSK